MGMLDGKVAIVTGASSGIGAAAAEIYLKEGAKVVLAARRGDRIEAIAAKHPGRALAVKTDVTQEADVIALFRACDKAFGPPDLVAACAGIADHTLTDELTFARWKEIVDTNLTSVFLCAREALRTMKPRKQGRIIIVGSISAKMPRPHAIGYTSTKFALDGMTRSLALDGREHGITVSIVHPGSTVTELVPNMAAKPPHESMAVEDVARTMLLMASLPPGTNLLEATILPIAQPFLGRG